MFESCDFLVQILVLVFVVVGTGFVVVVLSVGFGLFFFVSKLVAFRVVLRRRRVFAQ